MNAAKLYTVQALKWTAMAGSVSVFLFGGLIAISWLLFQFLVYLTVHLP
jgi:hypothetical protein